MDEVETEFPKSQELQPFLWLRYIDNIFFIWTHGEEKLTQVFNQLIITYETSSCTINFLDLNVSLKVTFGTKLFFAIK